MELVITPFESVGSIQFGALPEVVRTTLNTPWQTFLKDLDVPEQPTDAFNESGLHVHYMEGKCEAVECFAPATLTFQSKLLIGQPYREVKAWLASIDPMIRFDDCGLQACSFGIGIYAPNFSENENPDALVEGVLVGSNKFMEKEKAILRAAGLL
jgi:hypothetical protein